MSSCADSVQKWEQGARAGRKRNYNYDSWVSKYTRTSPILFVVATFLAGVWHGLGGERGGEVRGREVINQEKTTPWSDDDLKREVCVCGW